MNPITANSEAAKRPISLMAEQTGNDYPEERPVNTSGASGHSRSSGSGKHGKGKVTLASPIKTVLLSIAYVFWHFGNFLLIENNSGFLFFLSFLLMTIIYGRTVLTKWYKSIPLVVVSILIQNIGQLAMWPSFKAINGGDVSHWTSLVYAGYHLIIALVMALCAVVLFTVLEKVSKLIKK